ncbi:MAG TPA: nuclear transport factor 2 family protein [Solirubrobacteraceae bacterium]|nr:nuclear transport factor 2 family protein [Solirubrobacteraceae bacterium]
MPTNDKPSSPVRAGAGAKRPLTRAQAVSLAERYVGAYNNRDLQAMLAVQDENVVSYPSRLAGAQRHEGHAGVRAWWDTMVASGQWYEVVIREIRQPSVDQVAILGEIRDQGERMSPWCVVIRVRDDLITESHSYLSESDLLVRLGLIGDST